MSKQRYYVVWKGRKQGIFNSWGECERQVKGFVGAEYKAYDSLPEAQAAFKAGYATQKGRPSTLGRWKTASLQPVLPCICVDAACSGSPGPVEYRGVILPSGEELFCIGPFHQGTNNVGEFLAIVRGLTWLEKHEKHLPIYSDSENAIAWVNNGRANTKLEHTTANAPLFALIHSAENWLAENELRDDAVLKWDTKLWGENPADFGRK
jgi:ribonuclease HI